MRPFVAFAFLIAVLASNSAVTAPAADPCIGFKWDVSKEHALFSGPSALLTAGKEAASAPMIATDHLYEFKLTPQDQITFSLPPGKKMLTDGAYAGIAAFKVNSTGAYRVSVDVPFWIDVIADGKLVATKDFQGTQGCDAPHKIVEYELAAGQPLLLQVSGATKPSLRLTITQSPAAKPRD